MLEIKRETKPVKIEDQTYQLKKATNEARINYLKLNEEISKSDKPIYEQEKELHEGMVKYCESMGLPFDVGVNLDVEELTEIVKYVNEKKS